jgi:flagellar protein FliO/FliZ
MDFDLSLLQSPLVIVAGLLVLAALAFLAWVLTRERGPRSGTRQRRLRVLETAAVDSKNRLVLLRRDEAEHLVLIGPAAALVIETGIRPAPPQAPGEFSPSLFVPREREG